MQQVQIPTPPTPPAPPTIPAAPDLAGQTVVGGTPAPSTASANDVYEAMKAQRNELQRQLGQLEEKRRSIASRLREGEVSGADKGGLEARLTDLDAQITEMYKKLGVANDQVARAAVQHGVVVPDFAPRGGPPEEVIVMGFVLAMTMILPISIAIARRIWRRGSAPASAPISREMDERMSRLEQAMDAVAVEIERVGEGQRYMTRVLGSGAAEPLAVRAREGIEVKR